MHLSNSNLASSAQQSEHVLLVCPPVFSYHSSIKAEMEALGYAVTWWDDRGKDHTLSKIGLRLMPNLVTRMLTPLFLAKLVALKAVPLTKILIIKGEGMSFGVIKALKQQFPAARMSLYLWDSVENAPRARQIAPLFDVVATFDPVDARRFGWGYRPLFARKESLASSVPAGHRYDWCFVGTIHSDRHRVIQRLRQSNPLRSVFVFGFLPSRLLMILHMLLDISLRKAPPGMISTRAMAAADVAAVCSVSRAMLDVEHPRQRGLTMRTIEALLSGRKLITTNVHVRDSDLFDNTRIYIISRSEPAVTQSFFDVDFKPIPESVRARYSLTQWVRDLIESPSEGPQALSAATRESPFP